MIIIYNNLILLYTTVDLIAIDSLQSLKNSLPKLLSIVFHSFINHPKGNDDPMNAFKRTIIKDEAPSSYLGEARSLRISLPHGYNELLSYPVLYCQDGEDFFNFGRIVTQANTLILKNGLDPFLIIGVDVDKKLRWSEYHPEGERFARYCAFFAEELLPYIEENYPARTRRDERVIAGDSLGGTVSLHLALDYPELFGSVISFSGAFFPVTQQRIAEESDLSELSVFQTVGLKETAFQSAEGVSDFVELNRSTRALLEHRKANVYYEETDGDHVWGAWQPLIPKALAQYFGGSM
jgi:enterochelin esterase-like enzyme